MGVGEGENNGQGHHRHKLGGVTKVRREKKPQRKVRSHWMENEPKSQMRNFLEDRDTKGMYTRAVNYKRIPNSFLCNQWPQAELLNYFFI